MFSVVVVVPVYELMDPTLQVIQLFSPAMCPDNSSEEGPSTEVKYSKYVVDQSHISRAFMR